MTDTRIELRGNILLAFQVALLGMVSSNIRGITVGWDTDMIRAHFYYDGIISDLEKETASDVEDEIIASFPKHEVFTRLERLDHPQALNPKTLIAWGYRRQE